MLAKVNNNNMIEVSFFILSVMKIFVGIGSIKSDKQTNKQIYLYVLSCLCERGSYRVDRETLSRVICYPSQ